MFKMIVLMDPNGGISSGGHIPFSNKADMQNFKRLTMHHVVVMGRRTWKTIPSGHLKDRVNVVLSRSVQSVKAGVRHVSSIDECVEFLKENYRDKLWFVIGGADLYNQMLSGGMIDVVYMTIAHSMKFNCDTYIDINLFSNFHPRTLTLEEKQLIIDMNSCSDDITYNYSIYINDHKTPTP